MLELWSVCSPLFEHSLHHLRVRLSLLQFPMHVLKSHGGGRHSRQALHLVEPHPQIMLSTSIGQPFESAETTTRQRTGETMSERWLIEDRVYVLANEGCFDRLEIDTSIPSASLVTDFPLLWSSIELRQIEALRLAEAGVERGDPQSLKEQAESPDPSADHIEAQLLSRDDEAAVRNKALYAFPRGMESQRLEVQRLEGQIGQWSQDLRWVPQSDRIRSDVG